MNKIQKIGLLLFNDIVLRSVIVFILIGVYSNFFLGPCACSIEQDADATITFEQEDSEFNRKHVTVTVSQMDNADYLIVKEQTENHTVTTNWAGKEPSDLDYAPNKSSQASSAENEMMSGVLVTEGDKATVYGLSEGEEVQVYGGLDGSENLIQAYEVQSGTTPKMKP